MTSFAYQSHILSCKNGIPAEKAKSSRRGDGGLRGGKLSGPERLSDPSYLDENSESRILFDRPTI